MNEPEKNEQYYTHSRRSILVSTAVAAGVAALILVTIVLPVEYNIDPTGIASSLGLTVLATSKSEPARVTELPQGQPVAAAADGIAQLTQADFKRRR